MFKVGDRVRFKMKDERCKAAGAVSWESTIKAMEDEKASFDTTYVVSRILKGTFGIRLEKVIVSFSDEELKLVKPYSIKGLYDV